jgi:alanine racemase
MKATQGLPPQKDFHRPTWCEIDLGAIAHNVRQLRELVGPRTQIFVCLKGDATGCGAPQVALSAEAAGAHGFAFGNIDTAIECRRAGVQGPMLLYPTCLPTAARVLEQYRLSPTVSTLDDVRAWQAHAQHGLPVFLKIDSGGFRAGAFPDDAGRVAAAILASPQLTLAGVYGHSLAVYGTHDPRDVDRHVETFLRGLAAVEQVAAPVAVRMCSSSEMILSHPEADLNAVDPGRLICGIGFPAKAQRERHWQPALVGLKSRIVMTKDLRGAAGVHPASFVRDREDLVIGLVPFGWSDGFPKTAQAAQVLVRGRRVPVLGPIHSELMRLDLSGLPEAQVGDEVVFLGRSGAEQITLEELADQWDMQVFDIFMRVGKALPRVFMNPQEG